MKGKLLLAGALTGLSMFAVAGTALAEGGTSTTLSTPSFPPGLTINPNGATQIKNGKVTMVTGGTILIKIFGIPISVTTSASSTKFTDIVGIMQILPGDMVSVN